MSEYRGRMIEDRIKADGCSSYANMWLVRRWDKACWNVRRVLTMGQDERDNKIGAANRDNVRSFLSSLAIYPFSKIYMHKFS